MSKPTNGTLKLSSNLATLANNNNKQQQNSNIPTNIKHTNNTNNNFLPRYNPPPPAPQSQKSLNPNLQYSDKNPTSRRLLQPQQRSRYSTGTLIPPQQQQPQQQQQQHHQPALASPALSSVSGNQIVHQQQQQQGMLKFQVRKSDADGQATTTAHTAATTTNAHIQSLIAELRVLKETNARLIDDNQELRDLCCFLDDDRQKGRKLAREWNRFGKYTASVMRSEVQAYQTKLRQLDDKQQELIRDNLELKELCLYLDEERTRTGMLCTNCGATSSGGMLRDDGDGSSSSTNADEPINRYALSDFNIRSTSTNGDQTLSYVRYLENKIRELEEGRSAAQNDSSGRPEAVIRALQVLEVREQLERNSAGNQEQMNATETALVREMLKKLDSDV